MAKTAHQGYIKLVGLFFCSFHFFALLFFPLAWRFCCCCTFPCLFFVIIVLFHPCFRYVYNVRRIALCTRISCTWLSQFFCHIYLFFFSLSSYDWCDIVFGLSIFISKKNTGVNWERKFHYHRVYLWYKSNFVNISQAQSLQSTFIR